jgi:hypothetical protein
MFGHAVPHANAFGQLRASVGRIFTLENMGAMEARTW